MPMHEDIKQNIADIRSKIKSAAEAAGKSADDIKLIAATKTVSAERVRAAIACGVDACGENRVQELVTKLSENAYEGAPLHFIGHLQTNKVRQVVGKVDLIESVDSERLLLAIDKRAAELGIVQDILLEVNIGQEQSKSGALENEARKLAGLTDRLDSVRLRGLMAIPPISPDLEIIRGYFKRMYQLYVDIREKKDNNTHISVLSMGMSDDYEQAILEGATCVRIGSGIFGARN